MCPGSHKFFGSSLAILTILTNENGFKITKKNSVKFLLSSIKQIEYFQTFFHEIEKFDQRTMEIKRSFISILEGKVPGEKQVEKTNLI